MSKKRPRATRAPPSRPRPINSKQEPQYSRKRVFKGRYTYKGNPFEARNWSVKIQHLGKRKTIALQSNRRSQAAAQACELYRALVAGGWQAAIRQGRPKPAPTNLWSGEESRPVTNNFNADYWAQRLIHREYTMNPEPALNHELSVRIDPEGTGHYFPLGTPGSRLAARRALRIYRTIVGQGWEAANQHFSRELTVAFHWLDVPLAWTYTTIHTLPPAAAVSPLDPLRQAKLY